jgi:hypothetical protein
VTPGWSSLTRFAEEFIPPRGVIGIVIAQAFPDAGLIREKITEGIQRAHPDTVWVMRDAQRDKHAAKVAWETFEQFGIEPILAPLVPRWKYRNGVGYENKTREPHRKTLGWTYHDARAHWRDIEMRSTCERIIVFHDAKSGITSEWVDYSDNGDSGCIAKVYVVERGKKKVTRRKGRKPVGV